MPLNNDVYIKRVTFQIQFVENALRAAHSLVVATLTKNYQSIFIAHFIRNRDVI